MRIWFVYIDTWPAATRVLSRGRERTLGTRLVTTCLVMDIPMIRYFGIAPLSPPSRSEIGKFLRNHDQARWSRKYLGVMVVLEKNWTLVIASFYRPSLLSLPTTKETSSSHFWPEKERLNDGKGFIFSTEFGEGVGMRGLLGAVQGA